MPSPLMRELAHHEYLRERLATEFPEADNETLRDTLEGLTNLSEMLAVVVRSYLDDRAMMVGLRHRLGEMQERLQRIERSAEGKRRVLAAAMERAGLSKLKEPDFTLSFRHATPTLLVHDEAQIPADYFKPQPAKLDRQAVLRELKAGRAISGTSLSNGAPSITVRIK